MKATNFTKPTVESHGIKDSVKFGIKASGLHHILGILRNQLYSDKILAVIREYTCNAVDAHTEGMCPERPIEVTLPNRMNPNFKVRDFGPALSDDDIHNIYAFYGESTKRNTNDQIGMLGIGSKAAFAYGDNFVINSYLNGKKHTYNAFIDPSQVGQISKLSTEDSNEEDGIEIVVPVNDGDADEFITKAKNLFEWFNVRPIIHGHKQFEYNDEKTLFAGNGWKWTDCTVERYSRKNEAIVVMGNIGYPIDEYALNLKHEDDFRSLLTDNLVLHVEIGDLEISASREKLQYTDYTRDNLKKTLKRVQKELSTVIGKEFDGCKTLFEAKCLYGSTFTTVSPLYALKDVIKKHLVWNGKPVDGSTFHTYNISGVGLHKFTKGYRGAQKYRPDEQSTIHCEKGVVVIENDLGHRRGIMGKMLPLIITQEKTPYLIHFEDYHGQDQSGKSMKRTAKQVKAKFLKDEEFDGELIKLSSLPQHKLSEFGYGTTPKGSSYVKNSKHSAKCFEYDFDFSKDGRRYHTKKSDYWEVSEVDVDNESGIYVIIDKFHIEKPSDDSYPASSDPYEINNLKSVIEQAGIKFPKKIVAFKTGQRNKIEGKDGWVQLHTWAKEQITSFIESSKLHQAWIDIQKVDELNEYTDGDRYYGSVVKEQIQKLKKLNLADVDGVLGDFLQKHSEMKKDDKVHKQIKAIQTIAKEYGVDFTCPKGVKPTYEIKHRYIQMLDKYSMFKLLKRETWTYDWTSDIRKQLENYVNVIDLCNKNN